MRPHASWSAALHVCESVHPSSVERASTLAYASLTALATRPWRNHRNHPRLLRKLLGVRRVGGDLAPHRPEPARPGLDTLRRIGLCVMSVWQEWYSCSGSHQLPRSRCELPEKVRAAYG